MQIATFLRTSPGWRSEIASANEADCGLAIVDHQPASPPLYLPGVHQRPLHLPRPSNRAYNQLA